MSGEGAKPLAWGVAQAGSDRLVGPSAFLTESAAQRTAEHYAAEWPGVAFHLVPMVAAAGYQDLVRLVARLHADGGISHAISCSKFWLGGRTELSEVPTAFPCDCGLEAIFRHFTEEAE